MFLRKRRLLATLGLSLIFVFNISAEGQIASVGNYIEIVTVNNKKYVGQITERNEQKTVLHLELGGDITITNSTISTESVFQPDEGYVSAGIHLGRPAGINAALAYTVSSFRFGVEGLYLPVEYGVNFDAILLINRLRNFQHGIAINGGFFKENDPTDRSFQGSWWYVGPSYYLSINGWCINLGVSYGIGTFKSPNPIIGIGYIFDFRS